jgi:anti-sigma regulatory factor (Ser/Thr protein kinase)
MTPVGDVRRRYLPELACVPEARRLVARSVAAWGFESVADDAALCTAELVTNAVLHARTDLEVTVVRVGGDSGSGIHVGVRDASPRRLPSVEAPELEVSDLDTLEEDLLGGVMSRRGLRVVDSVASSWGVHYGLHDKTVWFRLLVGSTGRGTGREASEPGPAAGASEDDLVTVRLEGLPVRASLASGNNVDDILREFQLLSRDPDGSNGPSPQVIASVERHLERSVEDRLASRALARAAAGRGDRRFTMSVRLPAWAVGQVGALNDVLELVADACRAGELLSLPPSDEVIALRRWCASEVDRQLQGEVPQPCPLPE